MSTTLSSPAAVRRAVLLIAALGLLAGCAPADVPAPTGQVQRSIPAAQAGAVASAMTADTSNNQANTLDVYKSPTCGCCGAWIEHAEASGFDTISHHPDNLAAVKQQLGINPRYGSCHTAVSAQGFVFEGHVPARLVHQFLDNPPDEALGLAVPGMPLGSPGMEMGDRITPYQVLQLNRDGSTALYAKVDKLEHQH